MDSLKNHPTLTLSSAVQEAARPLFKKYNLNYFQYLTVYDDGSYSLLCNQAKWTDFIFQYVRKHNEPAVYSYISKKERLSAQRYYFLWEPNLPQKPVGLAREFNIANGLTFVERFSDRYNMIAFATPVKNRRAIDIYLNNIGELQQFIRCFQHDQNELIHTVEQHRIAIPREQHDANLKKMLLAKLSATSHMPIYYQGRKSYLTLQENVCLAHLAKGKSYKWIALDMQISPRTVETYLNRIKVRFELHSKKELIELYYLNQDPLCQ